MNIFNLFKSKKRLTQEEQDIAQQLVDGGYLDVSDNGKCVLTEQGQEMLEELTKTEE